MDPPEGPVGHSARGGLSSRRPDISQYLDARWSQPHRVAHKALLWSLLVIAYSYGREQPDAGRHRPGAMGIGTAHPGGGGRSTTSGFHDFST